MLLDPRLNRQILVQMDDNAMRLYDAQVCNPCEAEEYGYKIDDVLVSDFVYPAWYERLGRSEGARRFDHAGHMSEPFNSFPEGAWPSEK